MGKPRTSKKSPSASHASTITTIVFVAVCVLGVWMLSSNSVVPPQTTIAHVSTESSSSSITQTTTESKDKQKDQPVYEDNPGNLPNDAIKADNTNTNTITNNDQNSSTSETSSDDQQVVNDKPKRGDAQLSEESTLTQKQLEYPQATTQKDSQPEETTSTTHNQNIEEKSTIEESEGNQLKVEEQSNTNIQTQETQKENPDENQEQGKGQQEKVVQNIENNSDSKDEDQQNQKQLQEDKGEVQGDTQEPQNTEKDQQQQPQEEHLDITTTTIPETNQNKSQHEFPDVTNQGDGSQASQVVSDAKKLEPQQQQQQQQQQPQVEKEFEQKPKNRKKKVQDSNTGETFPVGENTGIPKESKESKKSWSTQADQSENEKERRKDESTGKESIYGYTWHLCNTNAGPDYIPCLDNEKAISQLRSRKHFEHRERHCPEKPPTCLVPPPENYKRPIEWPQSRDKIWYHNVPHTKLAEVKGHQNWVKVTGEFLTFPGGGTQFIHGALHYIDFLQKSVPGIAWGKHTRVILDVGCGVASFGGYLFERDVLTMSFAPKDEHEAQVQFALERGIPAISAVMGSQRLPFPSRVFDLVHCARCRVPWHDEGGRLLLELDRVLRPGGYFVWSATPVYQKLKEDVDIWKAMSALTASMCWKVVTIQKDQLNSVGAAIYRKPTSNECYEQRKHKRLPMCKRKDDPNAAWYVPLQTCIHRVPVEEAERGSKWPEAWPHRLQAPPYWLNSSQMGIYGKPAPQDFIADYEHWKRVVDKHYMSRMGISWSNVRNILDMRTVYGGFAAALKDHPVWVLNVVNVDSPDTLPIIFERGLFGIYHDWCESFSTYPRTYDLLHADHLFSRLKKRCELAPVMAEVDRIVRPGGKLIVRDESNAIGEVENLLKSLRWEVHLTFSKNQEGMLSAQKGDWRPDTFVDSS